MILLVLILISSNPNIAALLLLGFTIHIITLWNISLSTYLVGLIYVSGLLILLLFLTSLIRNLKQSARYNWLILLLTIPWITINFNYYANYNITLVFKSHILPSTVLVLIILLIVIVIIRVIVRKKQHQRSI